MALPGMNPLITDELILTIGKLLIDCDETLHFDGNCNKCYLHTLVKIRILLFQLPFNWSSAK